MRLLAARAMPFVMDRRLPLQSGPAVLAGLIGIATMLVIGVAAITGPDTPATPRAASHKPSSGETVVRKLAETTGALPAAGTSGADETTSGLPTSASHLLAMAVASAPFSKPLPEKKPNLAGLSEIPRELIWNRPQDKKDKAQPRAFAAFSSASEQLPWDAVEPVPFSPLKSSQDEAGAPEAAPKPEAAALQPVAQLDGGQVERWVKSKVTEIKGTDRARPLYHFELWLEPPADVKQRLVGVAYDFSTPAVRPQSQASSDKTSGFRISAGGLACADEITVTLRFDDGRSQKVELDGCKLLG